MVKLRYLQINQFRHMKPGRLDFADGFNVLLGKNGTGKTTLLRLLEAITRSDFSDVRHDAFDIEYEWATNDLRVLVHVQNAKREALDDLDFGQLGPGRIAEDNIATLRVELAGPSSTGPFRAVVATTEGRTTLRQGDGDEERLETAILPGQARSFVSAIASLLRQEHAKDEVLSVSLVDLYMMETPRFDESLGYYAARKADDFYVVGRQAKSPSAVDFEVDGYLNAHQKAKTKLGQVLSFPSTDHPFLDSFVKALGTVSHAALQLTLASQDADGVGVYGGLRLWLTRRDGSGFTDEALSYGQKRLFSFLYYLAAHSDTVIADELVNGLHHDWIDLCVRGIEKRQAFLTSQNPLLMDYLDFDSVEAVRKAFILCEVTSDDGARETFDWRNMSTSEASNVFEAAEVGIEHLSTILRNEGLW